MRVKLIATATDKSNKGYREFEYSLEHFGWDYEILIGTYLAYGSKMINAYNYAKITDYTHLFIVDAYDIFMLNTMEAALNKIENKDKIIFNAEKACWPNGDLAEKYPRVDTDWKYLNGGAAFVERGRFIKMFEDNPIQHRDNDQERLAEIYVNKRNLYDMDLDTNCNVFQSVAFEGPDDFTYQGGRIINNQTKTLPIIIHGNGGTDMSKVYKLLK